MDIIPYGGSLDHIRWPEGFREELAGKPAREQAARYRVTYQTKYSRVSYGDIDREDVRAHMLRLDECDDVLALAEQDGLIVGVQVRGHWGVQVCLPYQQVTTYYASDNNGAGSKERKDEITLVPIPKLEETARQGQSGDNG